MKTLTVKQKIEELTKPPPEPKLSDLDVLRELPEDIPAPTVSNCVKDGEGEANAWVSFRAPSYDPDKTHDPAAILHRLEGAGFVSLTATLVRWDDYRPGPWPSEADDVPETRGRYKFCDCWPMCPLWVTPCQHCGPDAIAFYRSPSGLVLRVCVDIPRALVCIIAKRVEFRGGWRYEPRTAKLHHPDAWHNLYMGDESVAGIHAKTMAQVNPPEGLDGVIYWEPYLDPFPMSAADMLTYLLESAEKQTA